MIDTDWKRLVALRQTSPFKGKFSWRQNRVHLLDPATPLDDLNELLKPKPDEETQAKPVDEPKKPEGPKQKSLF